MPTWIVSIAGFFWKNPWAALALLAVIIYGILKYQGHEITDLKFEKKQLVATVETQRVNHAKVVKAIDDKEGKDHDRNQFILAATAAIERGRAAASPASPVLLDAYSRVSERLRARETTNPR
jgi:hypothetical protein